MPMPFKMADRFYGCLSTTLNLFTKPFDGLPLVKIIKNLGRCIKEYGKFYGP